MITTLGGYGNLDVSLFMSGVTDVCLLIDANNSCREMLGRFEVHLLCKNGRLTVLRPSYKAPATENHRHIHSCKLIDLQNLLGLGRLATDLEYQSIRLTKHLKTSDWTKILDFQLALKYVGN